MRLAWDVLTTLVSASGPARAATTDLVVHCDRPLQGLLGAVAKAFLARTGVHVRVFPTAPNAIAAQIARAIQNDVVVTQPFVLARIEADGLLADRERPGPWRNRLVIAAKVGARRPQLPEAVVAAPDPVWGGGPDGPHVLEAAQLHPGHLLGTYDTDEARSLLLEGEADYALLHASEVGSGLEVVPVTGLEAELTYFAALTRLTRRPNPEALMHFLAGAEAAGLLRAGGLETLS